MPQTQCGSANKKTKSREFPKTKETNQNSKEKGPTDHEKTSKKRENRNEPKEKQEETEQTTNFHLFFFISVKLHLEKIYGKRDRENETRPIATTNPTTHFP